MNDGDFRVAVGTLRAAVSSSTPLVRNQMAAWVPAIASWSLMLASPRYPAARSRRLSRAVESAGKELAKIQATCDSRVRARRLATDSQSATA
ncbi:Uncharacterised protein [Mycobacteroides abscessus subsp. abscessus]|nr:Uncharacterised protein [Mycobacteroides abscessus subsp. abscessus]SHV04457.1 Uncharacterised protein [Mycobacteroides abscessus subsp. abscessus]